MHLVTQESPNYAHVSENASETQIDTTMTFTVLIVSIEQNEEFRRSRCPLHSCWDKIIVKNRRGFLGPRGGGVPEPLKPLPGYARVLTFPKTSLAGEHLSFFPVET